jgi:ribonuclease P protein component
LSPRKAGSQTAKVGIIVSKRVGNAVVRNRLRRRCKAVLDGIMAGAPPRWYVIQCNAKAAALSFAELRSQLMYVMTRAAQ